MSPLLSRHVMLNRLMRSSGSFFFASSARFLMSGAIFAGCSISSKVGPRISFGICGSFALFQIQSFHCFQSWVDDRAGAGCLHRASDVLETVPGQQAHDGLVRADQALRDRLLE